MAIFMSFVSTVAVLVAMWLRPSSFHAIFHRARVEPWGVDCHDAPLRRVLASGINFLWAFALTIGAVAVFADLRATALLIVAIVALISSTAVAAAIDPVHENPNAEVAAVISLLIVLVFVFYVFFSYVRQRAELQQLSDGLLLNILPETIAERLKGSDARIADESESSSILFADVAGFTPMSAEMTPDLTHGGNRAGVIPMVRSLRPPRPRHPIASRDRLR